MGDLAQLKPSGAQKYGKALKIPTLCTNGNVRLINAKVVDTTSEDYKAGCAAGAAECAERLEAEKARILDIGDGLKNAVRDIDERCRNDCAALIEQIFSALAPSMARHSALAEINEVIQKTAIRKKQAITILIHPDLANDLAMGNADGVSDITEISIETDSKISPNAVDISWADGGMFYDPDALITQISSILVTNNKSNEE